MRKRCLFGSDAHLAVTRDTRHDKPLLDDGTPDPEVPPALVLGLCLDKPGERPGYNGLKTISRLQERGYAPGYLAYDNSGATGWQLPVRALGYRPVYDYRVDQLGNQGGTQGAIPVEGTWYCPAEAGKVQCPLKDLLPPPQQRRGFNGFAKSPLAEAIESSRSGPIRGLAAWTVLLVFQLAHANRRKITRWLDSLALGGERPVRRTNRRRRTRPLGTWTPIGHLTPAT
ncbi:hypothetical protein [Streptomyces sp. NPDC088733]|uniref:hypothetical protein n=1 Tax=Streptomyces sp. NPDC088733 TaxID=3365880 RepID=UPI00380E1DA6